jgi:uncharacterized protein YcfJ
MMNSSSKKALLFTGSILGVVALSAGTTLIVQKLGAASVATAVPVATRVQAPALPATDVAQVISVKPHYIEHSTPYQHCEPVQHLVYLTPHEHFPAGALLGGAAGAFAGHSFGRGHGRIVGSVVGAALGALGGSVVQSSMDHPKPHWVYSTVCSTHYAEHEIQQGYDVTYSVNGHTATTVMTTAPASSTIPLPVTSMG